LRKKLNKANKSFIWKENESFELICDDEILKEISQLNKNINGFDENSFFKIEWMHNGRKMNNLINSRFRFVKNRLFLNKISVQDSGVYVCTAKLQFLEHRFIVDFTSIVIVSDKIIKKFRGEKWTMPCNGLVIKSIFQDSNINMTWFKDSSVIKNVPIDITTWSEYEHGFVDNFHLKKINYNDSGEYKCVVIDSEKYRSWTTNSIKIEVIDRKVDNLVKYKLFWIPLSIFSILFIILNLIVLLKNFLIKYEKRIKK